MLFVRVGLVVIVNLLLNGGISLVHGVESGGAEVLGVVGLACHHDAVVGVSTAECGCEGQHSPSDC